MIYRAAILSTLLAATSCASIPPPPTYSEVTDRYANQVTDREQVILTLIYACKDGMPYKTRDCKIKRPQIDIALKVVKELNKEANDLTTAVNKKVQALIECAYIGHLKDQKLAIIEAQAARDRWIGMGKQAGSYVLCGLILKSVL